MTGIPYFYIIRHKPTGKYYAGCKINLKADSSNLMTENGYQTTSKVIKNIIEKEGLVAFEVLRIKHFQTAEEVLSYETRFLLKVNAAENEKFINRHNGAKNFCNKGGYKLSDLTKNKMRKPKSKETIEKQNTAKRNRSPEVYERMVKTRRENRQDWHNDKMRQIISDSNKIRFSDIKNREKHSEVMKRYYKDNPISEKTIEKIRISTSGENNPMFGKKHNESTKLKMKAAWQKRKEKNFNK